MRSACIVFCLYLAAASSALAAIEQKWLDDLNQRFPGIGQEFDMAVQQKLAQHGGSANVADIIKALASDPDYDPEKITSARGFTIHSELMLLHPAVGNYQESLREAKLLRDFTLKHSPDDARIMQTFRGVYAELLIINGQYEQALQEIEETIALNPDEEGNYLSRGVVNVKLGQLENALTDLRMLIRKPDAQKYAELLFGFIMNNRAAFQESEVQKNTMIDVMLRGLQPQSDAKIRIPADEAKNTPPTKPTPAPAAPTPTPTPTPEPVAPTPTPTPEPQQPDKLVLFDLVGLKSDRIEKLLGAPTNEVEGEETIDRDYNYRGNTLTISFDKKKKRVVSFQMFFMPPIEEAAALKNIGIIPRQISPTITSNLLKVWTPYDQFSKVRLSLNNGNVIAIIVEP